MKINTKYFGEVDYEDREVISFSKGLFGFEDEHDFLLIRFDNEDGTLLSLQSVSTPALAFVVMNPYRLMPDYDPEVSDDELGSIGMGSASDIAVYVIAVVGDQVSDTTVNLKAPLIVNVANHKAMQVLLDDARYSFTQKFAAKQS